MKIVIFSTQIYANLCRHSFRTDDYCNNNAHPRSSNASSQTWRSKKWFEKTAIDRSENFTHVEETIKTADWNEPIWRIIIAEYFKRVFASFSVHTPLPTFPTFPSPRPLFLLTQVSLKVFEIIRPPYGEHLVTIHQVCNHLAAEQARIPLTDGQLNRLIGRNVT